MSRLQGSHGQRRKVLQFDHVHRMGKETAQSMEKHRDIVQRIFRMALVSSEAGEVANLWPAWPATQWTAALRKRGRSGGSTRGGQSHLQHPVVLGSFPATGPDPRIATFRHGLGRLAPRNDQPEYPVSYGS